MNENEEWNIEKKKYNKVDDREDKWKKLKLYKTVGIKKG